MALMAKTAFASVMQINFYSDSVCNSYETFVTPTGSGSSGSYWFSYKYPGYSFLIANCYEDWCCVNTNNADGSTSSICGTGQCGYLSGGGVTGITVSWGDF